MSVLVLGARPCVPGGPLTVLLNYFNVILTECIRNIS